MEKELRAGYAFPNHRETRGLKTPKASYAGCLNYAAAIANGIFLRHLMCPKKLSLAGHHPPTVQTIKKEGLKTPKHNMPVVSIVPPLSLTAFFTALDVP